MLEMRNVSVQLGARMALRGISLSVHKGTFLVVLGPNGAGKSTLLRVMAGLLPSDGQVLLDGSLLAGLSPAKRAARISYLPQNHTVHWPLTAREVVAIGRMPHASSLTKPTPEDEAAVDRALAATDAGDLASRHVTELSGGERARVLLARALAVEAPILIADEPIAALDPSHQIAVLELLRSLAAAGRIVVAALHDLTLSAQFAERVLVLDRGQLAADGPPFEVLDDHLLQRVFEISPAWFERDGRRIPVPWGHNHLSSPPSGS